MSRRRNRNLVPIIRIPINDHAYFTPRLIPSHAIITPNNYQRKIDFRRVDAIVAAFDPAIVSPLRVSHRDGKYYVFDGGHTLAALKKVNHDKDSFPVLCLVFENLTEKEESILFALQRGIEKRISVQERLNANVIGEEEDTMKFIETTEKAGLTLGISTKGEGSIRALGKAEGIRNREGDERYVETLSLIKDTWNGSRDSLTGNMMGGVSVFLREFGKEYNRERFIRKLGAIPPNQIRLQAHRKKASYQTMDAAFATEIGTIYNTGNGKGRILPPARITTITG